MVTSVVCSFFFCTFGLLFSISSTSSVLVFRLFHCFILMLSEFSHPVLFWSSSSFLSCLTSHIVLSSQAWLPRLDLIRLTCACFYELFLILPVPGVTQWTSFLPFSMFLILWAVRLTLDSLNTPGGLRFSLSWISGFDLNLPWLPVSPFSWILC